MKYRFLVGAAVLIGYLSSASAGSDVPLNVRLIKVGSGDGSLDIADMKCAQVADDPEKLKCTFLMMSLLWNETQDVYDQRATEAERAKSIDDAIAKVQSNPKSACEEIKKDAADEMKRPAGQRAAKFMDVETRAFFDKVLDACQTTDPGNLTARLISLMPRARMDAIIISMRTAQIQSENESCSYVLNSRTQTLSKQSGNKWGYKKRNARDNGCDSQYHSEVVFDPEKKEWKWSTGQALAPDVDPEKKCQVFTFHDRYKSFYGASMPSCKYISSTF